MIKNNFLEIKYGYWKITLRWLLRIPIVRLDIEWNWHRVVSSGKLWY
jgi:hypothetical protein